MEPIHLRNETPAIITKDLKVAFVHGRPKGHPIHALYARQLNAEFVFEDFFFRWHDDINAPKIKRYLSWIFNAVYFPGRKRYNIFFTECIRIPQLIMKFFGLMNNHQILIALMADESLYFNLIRKYPRSASILMKAFLRKADALICIGEFQAEIARRILEQSMHKKIYTIFNGVPAFRQSKLLATSPDLDSHNILFIGNASAEWRIWYKGIDIMLEAFAKSFKINNKLKFYLVGEIDAKFLSDQLNCYEANVRDSIVIVGRTDIVENYIAKSCLYLHCSRGDAFPTAILECLAAGLVSIISDCTGTRELIRNIDENLIVPLSSDAIAERINWFFALNTQEKENLSQRCRVIMNDYTEERAVNHFKDTFRKVISDLEKR